MRSSTLTRANVLDRLRITFDADDAAMGANQPRGKQRHVPGSGAQVKHAHTRPDLRATEHPLDQRVKQPGLSVQTQLLNGPILEDILLGSVAL
jgi:hypothetical protein